MNETHGIEIISEPVPRYAAIDAHAHLYRAYVTAFDLANRYEARQKISRRECIASGMRQLDWARGIKMLRASGAVVKNYNRPGGYEFVVSYETAKLLLIERRKRDTLLINSGRFPTYARVPPYQV